MTSLLFASCILKNNFCKTPTIIYIQTSRVCVCVGARCPSSSLGGRDNDGQVIFGRPVEASTLNGNVTKTGTTTAGGDDANTRAVWLAGQRTERSVRSYGIRGTARRDIYIYVDRGERIISQTSRGGRGVITVDRKSYVTEPPVGRRTPSGMEYVSYQSFGERFERSRPSRVQSVPGILVIQTE